MRTRLTLAGALAPALALTAFALPATALLPTDTRIGNPDGAASWEVHADDEEPGTTDPPTDEPPRPPAPVTNAQTPASSTPASPPRATTDNTIARVGSTACAGAQMLTGAVEVCARADTPSSPAPTRPQVSVATVRKRAVDKMTLSPPDVKASPCQSTDACEATVGVPVWLWIGDGDGTMPTHSASATAGRYTIKATAKVSKVTWTLGDGQSTTCSGGGTKYDPDIHGWTTPTCGFANGWSTAGTYTLTATYHWDISWTGDQTGSATQTISATRQVTATELQSVGVTTK